VPGFTVDQIKEMVQRLGGFMGLHFDEGMYAQLRDHFGGHPFPHSPTVQQAASSGTPYQAIQGRSLSLRIS
jgi:hypothetical protein